MEQAPFVSRRWVAAHLDDPDLRLVDLRWSLDGSEGEEQYLQRHLPGAVFADLDRDLAGPLTPAGGRHPLPDPDAFAAAMARLGIGDDDLVVAYDTRGGAIAARLVWMLRVLGRRAAVLADGPARWDGPTEAGPVDPAPGDFTPTPWPSEAVVDADEVARLAAGEGVVVDARDAPRYRGAHEPVDARAGHVPGAVNLPFADNLDEDGRLRADNVLRDRFVAAGISPDVDTAVYCGSGVTACHDVLAVELAGLGRPRLYVGSWSAWSADPDRPVATGDR